MPTWPLVTWYLCKQNSRKGSHPLKQSDIFPKNVRTLQIYWGVLGYSPYFEKFYAKSRNKWKGYFPKLSSLEISNDPDPDLGSWNIQSFQNTLFVNKKVVHFVWLGLIGNQRSGYKLWLTLTHHITLPPADCTLGGNWFSTCLSRGIDKYVWFGINVHHILRKYLFLESDLYRTGWHSLWKTLFSQKCSPTYCIGVSFPLESIWEGFSQSWYFIFLKKSYILVDQYFPDYFSKLWNVISYILPVGVLCTLTLGW